MITPQPQIDILVVYFFIVTSWSNIIRIQESSSCHSDKKKQNTEFLSWMVCLLEATHTPAQPVLESLSVFYVSVCFRPPSDCRLHCCHDYLFMYFLNTCTLRLVLIHFSFNRRLRPPYPATGSKLQRAVPIVQRHNHVFVCQLMSLTVATMSWYCGGCQFPLNSKNFLNLSFENKN